MPGKALEMLSQPELDFIHTGTMRLLREVGVVVPVDEALQIFKRHGARVEGKRVYLDESLLMQAVSTAPPEFTVHARDAKYNVIVGGDRHVFAPGFGPPFVMELDGTARVATMDDLTNLTRLVDALPEMDISSYMLIEPSDAPTSTAHLHMLRAIMVNSSKPFIGSANGTDGARASIEMAGILFGDQEGIRERPVMVSLVNSHTPLGYSRDMVEGLIEHANWRQPVLLAAAPQAGVSSPITMAGTLTLANAEILTGITLSQIINPGTPVVYGSVAAATDMRLASMTIGSPELSMAVVCTGQIARYYGLPSRAGGCLTDSHQPDAQAGLESMMSMLTAVQSGINFVLHSAGILSSFLTISYEKLIIDAEICAMVRRFEQGINVTPEELALDVIASVGPGGSYLMENHTLERCRSAFYSPQLAERRGINNWQARGCPTSMLAARERWQTLLASHIPDLPDAGVLAQLDHYVETHS